VTSEQVEFVRDAQRDARKARAGEAEDIAFPEIAVVHENGVGAFSARRLDQIKAKLAVTSLTTRRISPRPSTCRPFGQ